MSREHEELLESIAAEAEHAEATPEAELSYRRRSTGPHQVYGEIRATTEHPRRLLDERPGA